MPATEPPLAGVRVLVTRPAHQAAGLMRAIENAGGVAILFPTIEIAPPRNPERLAAVIARLTDFDIAVFVSPNAVERAIEPIRAQGGLPPKLAIYAVGAGTAAVLRNFGIDAVAPDDRSGAEALLALEPLTHVAGRRVVIFRGEDGTELLAEALRTRGAQVEYAECYRRAPPTADAVPLVRHFERGEIDLVTITNTEGLRHLHTLLPPDARVRLTHTPIVVVSARQAALCRELGFVQPAIVARAATDNAILNAINHWHHSIP